MRTRMRPHKVVVFAVLLSVLPSFAWSSSAETAQFSGTRDSSHVFGGLADSPWPMYQHDIRRTSRSPFFGPSQPRLEWQYANPDGNYPSTAIGPDGTIYVGSNDRRVHAINPDGTPKWTYGPLPHTISSAAAVADDGTVYVGHHGYSEGNLVAINPDGTLKWQYPAREVRSSPAIAPDGTIYVGASDARLYAINPNGSLKWRYRPGFAESYSSPAIGADGTIYVAGVKERNIHAVNPDGTTKWTYPIGTSADTCSSPTVDDNGTVYIGGSDSKLYALNPDGTLNWSYTVGEVPGLQQSAALGPDGTVYIISADGTLWAFTSSGELKWRYFSDAGVIRTTPTVGADGVIYFGGQSNGKLYAINPDGSEKWTYQTPASILGAVVIKANGLLYASSSKGVFAIGENVTPTPTNVYLPAVLHGYSPNPYEDNDSWQTAYGPLDFEQAYWAYPDDQNDYYYFELLAPRNVTIQLSNYQAEGDLVLYEHQDGANPLYRDHWGRGGSSMTLRPPQLEWGKYYVRVYTAANHNAASLYALTVARD